MYKKWIDQNLLFAVYKIFAKTELIISDNSTAAYDIL